MAENGRNGQKWAKWPILAICANFSQNRVKMFILPWVLRVRVDSFFHPLTYLKSQILTGLRQGNESYQG